VQAEKHRRVRELVALLDRERDHDRFSEMVAELNRILDEEKPLHTDSRPKRSTGGVTRNG
jgi:hypothetical protein